MTFDVESLLTPEASTETFTDEGPPYWLTCKEFSWWYEEYVLKLKVGESIDSDFRRITRTS